jgi:hypothetical protein
VSERVCAHWPLEGVVRVHAAAVSLGMIAQQWVLPQVSSAPVMGLLEDVRQVRARVAGLLQEFRRVGDWLARGAGVAAGADGMPSNGRVLAASLAESHRLLVKDRHAADMNALIAWLLQQVVQMLDEVPLQTTEDEADLLDMPAYGKILQRAADMLQNAARVADASERFVEDLDERWHQLRHQITAVVASARGSQSAC